VCNTCGHITQIPIYWQPTAGLGDYIQKIFDRILKAGQIDKNQVKATFDTLYKGVEKGYGKKLINIDYDTPDAKKLAFMQRNVFVFSAYKSYQNVIDINKALLDDKGNVRPFNEFKKLATTIDEAFNKRYLETEYNMAVLSGRAAEQWQEFESMADTYPLLQYQTIGDANVRPEHEALNNVIRPINDPFWTIFYPPNDWGCRCDVVQVTDENAKITKKEDIKAPDMKPIFKNNVGITGKVFPDSHPYYDVLKEHKNAEKNLWGLAIPDNEGKKSELI
jgi:SPP1 gp7 family putative phage head morphogenesis protein